MNSKVYSPVVAEKSKRSKKWIDHRDGTWTLKTKVKGQVLLIRQSEGVVSYGGKISTYYAYRIIIDGVESRFDTEPGHFLTNFSHSLEGAKDGIIDAYVDWTLYREEHNKREKLRQKLV